ncbi:uncharacterized protein [Solanum lycopersicum]|uniref:uncharacterized protein n=1 Tax=Solanum lycopersicum TaxID=4081 RepID=UPI00374925B9
MVEEFIKLHQEGMSFKKYSFKFIKLSKSASSFISIARDEMSHFITGVYEDFVEKCREAPLHENMDNSMLKVHAQQLEECRLRKKNMEANGVKSFESGCSKSRLDVQNKPKFKKSFSNQVPFNFSKNHNDKGSNPKPQKGRNVNPQKKRPTHGKRGKKNVGECLVGTNSCYGCGKGVHKVKYCPNVISQGKGNSQFGPSSEAPKRNRLYAFRLGVNKKSLRTL